MVEDEAHSRLEDVKGSGVGMTWKRVRASHISLEQTILQLLDAVFDFRSLHPLRSLITPCTLLHYCIYDA